MGRREQPVPPGPLHDFAVGLRQLRAEAGNRPYRELARMARYSTSALSAAAAGQSLPTLQLTLAYVRACGGDEREWRERWQQLAALLRATNPELLALDTVRQEQDGELAEPDGADDAGTDGSRGRSQQQEGPVSSPDGMGTSGPLAADKASRSRLGQGAGAGDGLGALGKGDPRRLGRIRLLGVLGGGMMGRVYLGATPAGRPVAVKAIRPELADDAVFRRRFAAEVAALKRVQGVHTVAVVAADVDGTQPWVATAFLSGPALAQAVDEGGALPPGVVSGLLAGIAEALEAIHAAGVVHRDLKPSNIMLQPDGPKVIDFGIARAAGAPRLTSTGLRVGSAPFMAPEQALGREIGPAADVFALGCVGVYAATGRSPFGDGPADAVLYRVVHEPPDLSGIPDAPLRQLLGRCLAKTPADRPSPAEVIEACTQHAAAVPAALAAQAAARDEKAAHALRIARTRQVVRIGTAPLLLMLALVIALIIADRPASLQATPPGSGTGTLPASHTTAPGAVLSPTPSATGASRSAPARASSQAPAPAVTGGSLYDQTLGVGCPKPGDNLTFTDQPFRNHPWTSASAVTWPVSGCASTLLYSAPTTNANPDQWENDYGWIFADVPTNASCTFHIYIADSPYSQYNTLYFWTTGGPDYVDQNAFTVHQAAQRGQWVSHGPLTFPTGKAMLEITDTHTGSTDGTLTASAVRLTCD